jgi:uncharacterized protein (AIM24 family)
MPDDIRDILKRAKALFDEGKLEEARAALDVELSTNPKDAKLLNFLAYLSYRLGDLGRARDTYRRLTGLDPENLTVWSNLGIISFKLELFEEARIAFLEYLKREPQDAKVLSYMARVMEKMDRTDTAKEFQRKAREQEPAASAVTEAQASGGDEAVAPVPEEPPRVASPPVSVEPPRDPLEGAVPLQEWLDSFDEEDGAAGRRFSLLSSVLVSVALEQRLVFSLPTLVSYNGIVVFESVPDPYGKIPRDCRSDSLVLMAAEGNGTLRLTHPAGWPVALKLETEALVLNAHNILAFDATLDTEWVPLGKEKHLPGLTTLRLAGQGILVLAAGEGLSSVALPDGMPVFVRPSAVVAWTGNLDPMVDSGDDFKKVKRMFEGPFLRFEGEGRILITGGILL